MKRRLRFGPPKTTFATRSGTSTLPMSVPSGSRQCTPSPALDQMRPSVSSRKPSKTALVQLGEDLAARQLAVVGDPEDADVLRPVLHMRGARVGDVEQPLVRRESEAVRAHEIVGGDADRSRAGVDAIDVAGADLALGLVALVIRVDAVGRIGEPDRAVGSDDDVVRAVEALALEALGEDRDRAVVLGAGDAPVAVLARDETAFAVDGVAVRIAGRRPEDAGLAGRLVEAQHAVVRDVAPDERTLRREVGGTFGPAAALVELLDPRRDLDQRPEALVQNREIAAAHGASPVSPSDHSGGARSSAAHASSMAPSPGHLGREGCDEATPPSSAGPRPAAPAAPRGGPRRVA